MQSSLYLSTSATASPAAHLSSSALIKPFRAAFSNIKSVGVALRSIYFSVYGRGKQFYTSLNNGKETSAVHMISAATAGFATALFSNPIWLVKTRMQLQNEVTKSNTASSKSAAPRVYYKNSLHCASEVVRTEGIRGLYKGLSASLLGLSESTLQFVLYEHFKKSVSDYRAGQNGSSLSVSSQLHFLDTFGIAACAKLIAAVATYPHEVLRTRLRQDPGPNSKYKGLFRTAAMVYREEGFAGLYGGMTAHLLRVIPNACILFGTVEFILALAK
ncbi:hypothetical protein HK100_005201 [Physocladia obscura]|uniref:Mitochondrial carrier protein n=1 Tax=Physocladia obscura TaxID=109957 RepID=A0AAD5SU76_9FUNG|nr:hypothetical protein HK100_005201 [Physocladia obscura]